MKKFLKRLPKVSIALHLRGVMLFLALSFAFCVLSLGKVFAQTSLPLTVAPSRQEATIDPGKTLTLEVKFFNRGDSPVSGLLKVADFIVEDKEGTPTFIEETPTVTGVTQISPRFSAASWVTLPYDRITIAPKDKVLIQAKITAPIDARPGGKYLAIYFEPGGALVGGEEQKELAIASRIAGLVYLRVSGPVTEDAYLIQFAAPRFLEYGPVPIITEILNRGDYHIRPLGTITLTNMLGREVDKVELKETNIFPDASRIFENKVGQKWMFGKYKAKLSASYGETGKALSATIFFWVFPWKVATAVLLAILIIILITYLIHRHFKRREEELEAKLEEEEKEVEELKKKLKEKGE